MPASRGIRPRAKTEKERRERRAAVLRRYALSPKGKFKIQKNNAKLRGVPFLLTFDEWWQLWQDSGKWDERGNAHADQYVMGRHHDRGPYAVGNVSIIRNGHNVGVRNQTFAARKWYGKNEDEDWQHVHGAECLDD